jgi:hypothetical protein
VHPALLHQLTREHQAERARAVLASTRARDRSKPNTAPHGPWRRAGARLQAGLGWLLVDVGFRLATRRVTPRDDPYAGVRS